MTSPRFVGDPVLSNCRDALDTMSQGRNADGLAVQRVQVALSELGFSVGVKGADGFFGPDTGNAVARYKATKGLVPDDPVIGPGTSGALDDDFAITTPQQDPDLGDLTEFVRALRVEPFVAAELTQMQQAPLVSWRHMLALFALDALQRDRLVGIAAVSRLEDLKPHYLTLAADPQGALTASAEFDGQVTAVRADKNLSGRTITFADHQGVATAYISIGDDVLLGRAFDQKPNTTLRLQARTREVLAHELTHERNLLQLSITLLTNDTDPKAFVDTGLAVKQATATGISTAHELQNFVEEVTARHVAWIVVHEDDDDPDAAKSLDPAALAAAADVYITTFVGVVRSNRYLEALNNPPDPAKRFRQLALWLKVVAGHSFSDDFDENTRTRQLFEDAAAFCDAHAGDPTAPVPDPDGLFPLPSDFK